MPRSKVRSLATALLLLGAVATRVDAAAVAGVSNRRPPVPGAAVAVEQRVEALGAEVYRSLKLLGLPRERIRPLLDAVTPAARHGRSDELAIADALRDLDPAARDKARLLLRRYVESVAFGQPQPVAAAPVKPRLESGGPAPRPLPPPAAGPAAAMPPSPEADGQCLACPSFDHGPFTPTAALQTHDGETCCTSGDCNWYAFDVTCGNTYRFTTCTPGSTSFDSIVQAWDPTTCTIIASNDDACGVGSDLTYTASFTGRLHVRVHGFGGATGSYTLAFEETATGACAGCATCGAPTALLAAPTPGCQMVSGSTTASCPAQIYGVPLEAGKTYLFTLCGASCPGAGADYDSRLRLVSPGCDGTLVDDDDSCGALSEIAYTAAVTGLHRLQVTGFTPAHFGDFALGYREIECTTCEAATPPHFGPFTPAVSCQSHAASFDACEGNFYDFQLVGGFTYVFSTCDDLPGSCPGGTAAFDSILEIYDQACAASGSDDDGCGFPLSRLVFTPPADGTYPLRVRGFGRGSGDYTLTYLRLECTTEAHCDDQDPCTQDSCLSNACQHEDLAPLTGCIARRVACPGPAPADGEGKASDPAAALAEPRTRAEVARLLLASASSEEARARIAAKLGVLPEQLQVEEGIEPLRRSRPGEALSCVSPCTSGVLAETSNPFYDLFVQCADGAFTARTGTQHPVTVAAGSRQNVFFGGEMATPGTSTVGFFVHNTGVAYLSPIGGQACAFTPPPSPREPGAAGIEVEWTRAPAPGLSLTLREEVVAFGTSPHSSGLRLTLGAANAAGSSQDAHLGVRWLADYQNAGDDGPGIATIDCSPFGPGPESFAEHEFAPAEVRDFYRMTNNAGQPVFSNFNSTAPIVGFPTSSTPDRLLYGRWDPFFVGPWNQAALEGADADSDSAVLYYYGYAAADAIVVPPGQEFRRSLIVFSSSNALSCDPYRANGEETVCAGDCVLIGAEASDSCGASATLVDATPGGGACVGNPCVAAFPAAGDYVYTWEGRDGAGQISTCTSTVHVSPPDNAGCNQLPACALAPSFTGACREVLVATATVADPDEDPIAYAWTSSDPEVSFSPASGLIAGGPGNRPVPPTTVMLASAVTPCGHVATIFLAVEDGQGGMSSCAAQVSFDDDIAPLLDPRPAAAAAACEAVPAPPPVVAVDGCDPGPQVTFTESRTDGNCLDRYQLARMWTASDVCDNVASHTQVVTVDDLVGPTLSATPADVAAACDAVPAAAVITASDNCDPAVAVVAGEQRIDGTCPDSYRLVRTWTATDRCGNLASHTQTVTVTDTTAPVLSQTPADVTVECDAVPAAAVVTASDNCAPPPTVVYAEQRVDGTCPDSYRLVRTWTATDRCGNLTSHTQTVTVTDTTAPVLSQTPADVTVECDAVPAAAVVTASDNCAPPPTVVYAEQRVDGTCPDSYQLVRTWTATDRCGNLTSHSQLMTVQDTIPPVPAAGMTPTAPLPPLPPRSAISACAPPTSRAFRIACAATDNCDPAPALAALLRVTNHDVPVRNGACVDRVEEIAVACDEVVELRLVAPPCPARPPRSPAVALSVNALGIKVVTGERVELVLTATDRCGNAATVVYDPALSPSPLCEEQLPDLTCCPAIGPPPDPRCRVPLCGTTKALLSAGAASLGRRQR